ncbi:putative motility protein [Amphritea atlantica]|uniref:Motility protein n=1 Tax=Amphritea atlantica TaxID=355243 RepID=A0ABY5GXK4_9GAMM|nr:putative motility protein [Amphritea atlantica]
MEISAASASAYQQSLLQHEVATAVAGKAKDNLELQGAMALELLESAAMTAVDPSSSLGQNIDIMA